MIIGLIIGVIVVVLLVLLVNRKKPTTAQKNPSSGILPTVDQSLPDSPIGFGYKCMWFAVKTGNKNRVAEILKINNLSNCNWQVGIDRAYNNAVFITPAIDGWTLACGWGLPHGDSKEGIEEVKGILEILSREFGEAQFFCTHRVTEYHCWMIASNGQVTRVYSYLGESGDNIVIEGQPTEFEQTLHLINTFLPEAIDESDLIYPDEDLVMQVAGHWSIDPTKLDERKDIVTELGLLGNR